MAESLSTAKEPSNASSSRQNSSSSSHSAEKSDMGNSEGGTSPILAVGGICNEGRAGAARFLWLVAASSGQGIVALLDGITLEMRLEYSDTRSPSNESLYLDWLFDARSKRARVSVTFII